MNRWIDYLIEQGYFKPMACAAHPAIDTLPDNIAHWPGEWREVVEERTAIMECDGGLERSEAEGRSEAIVRTMYARSWEPKA